VQSSDKFFSSEGVAITGVCRSSAYRVISHDRNPHDVLRNFFAFSIGSLERSMIYRLDK
jgi:hypothetical protein